MKARRLTLLLVAGISGVLLVNFVIRQIPNEPVFYYYVKANGTTENVFTREPPPDPLFTVRVRSKIGYINAQGDVVLPALYENAYPFSGGLAAVALKRRWGYIDTAGTFVIEPQFAQVGRFKEGLAAARRTFREPWGYIDRSGAWVIAPGFDTAAPFHEGIARVGFETLWSGVRANFADVGMLCRYRYINREGQYVDRPDGFRFDSPSHTDGLGPRFTEDLAPVLLDGLYGFIDLQGNVAIKPQFAYAYNFEDGLAQVTVRDDANQILAGYINHQGDYVWTPSR